MISERYHSPLSETIKKSISEKISWRPPPAPLKVDFRKIFMKTPPCPLNHQIRANNQVVISNNECRICIWLRKYKFCIITFFLYLILSNFMIDIKNLFVFINVWRTVKTCSTRQLRLIYRYIMSPVIRLGMRHWGGNWWEIIIGRHREYYDKSQAKRIFSRITMHLHPIYTGLASTLRDALHCTGGPDPLYRECKISPKNSYNSKKFACGGRCK